MQEVSTNNVHSGKPSGIPLPKRPPYTLPRQRHTVCPCLNRGFTAPILKDLRVPAKTEDSVHCNDKCSIEKAMTWEMRAKVANMLQQNYISTSNSTNGMQIKIDWTTEYDEGVGMFRLKHSITATTVIEQWSLKKFLNKPRALYWAHSAQERDRCRLVPFACIYKDWFRYFADDPNFRFRYFFANPIQITATGPKTIASIRDAHKSLCDRASSLFDMSQQGEAGEAHSDNWLSPQDYKLLPLCRAVLIILDETPPNPGARISLEKEVQRQNVLIVRTKDEAGLSEPIKFDTIRSQSLPLARSDINTDESENLIRVSLRTAVKFILDLQRREEMAFPNLHRDPSDRSVRAEEYATRILREVDEKGISNVPQMNFVLERIIEEEKGAQSYSKEFDFWSPMWE